ncbi:tetratricopeptide repeat protein [Kroppenstedtia eburnea]|uniref:Tetratricopeptide repeat-containing protein n=2 Tax=Kroppenstedtia eburnea TaxID=714067 RepID=A0A1N7NAY7_9BACL|nr:Tetratricopeptide repeat-containing protein [Kroppenstedtia eburnea]
MRTDREGQQAEQGELLMAGSTAAKAESVHTEARTSDVEVLARTDSDVGQQYELARTKVRKRRFAEALAALEELKMADPFHVKGHLLRAQTLQALGRMTESRSLFEEILSQYPDYSEAYREYGCFLLSEGAPEAAQAHLLKGLTLNPQDAFAHALLAEVYALTGRKEQAFLHLEIASRFRTEEIRYFEVYARVLSRLEELTEEVHFLKEAVFTHADNRIAKAHFKKAMRAQRREKKGLPVFMRFLRVRS